MLRYFIFLALLPACTAGRFGDENCTTIKRGSFPVLTTPDSSQWSIVDFRQIDNHCLKNEFVYVGSHKDYHLILWDYNGQTYAGVEHNFAVLKGTFSPDSPVEYNGRSGISANRNIQRVFK